MTPASEAGRVIRIAVERPARDCPLDQYDATEWAAAMQATLGKAIVAAQDAVESLIAEGGGVVLFIVPGYRGDAAWQASVAGLHGLLRAIAKEYGRMNVRCNGVVGDAPELERLLVANDAVTGELLVAVDGTWGASGLERA
jgi:NAD(P)-dependent dehydrogenase (short-subunit alcohol dehydrogenase family)